MDSIDITIQVTGKAIRRFLGPLIYDYYTEQLITDEDILSNDAIVNGIKKSFQETIEKNFRLSYDFDEEFIYEYVPSSWVFAHYSSKTQLPHIVISYSPRGSSCNSSPNIPLRLIDIPIEIFFKHKPAFDVSEFLAKQSGTISLKNNEEADQVLTELQLKGYI